MGANLVNVSLNTKWFKFYFALFYVVLHVGGVRGGVPKRPLCRGEALGRVLSDRVQGMRKEGRSVAYIVGIS